MNHDQEPKNFHDLPPPQDLPDAVERLISVLYWLDANGHSRAAIDVNDALEKLLCKN